MSSGLMKERSVIAPSGPGFQAGAIPSGAPAISGWSMVPRCEITFEKCKGGFKLHCKCEDEIACGTLQNMCRMLCEGTCSCVCTCNGMTVCQCNLIMGICKCDYTKDGVCITCLSGDSKCCEMIQACCDCLQCCCEKGCCCYVCFGGTPICCGIC
ncbi:MAG: hypothetical protein SGJ20_19690 [Planctomycetota bacterium]|nr:hypothetical protein [Planctomycetota bacterium]